MSERPPRRPAPRQPAPRFTLGYHAQTRMRERGILIADIEYVLGNWDVHRPARRPTEMFMATIFDRIERRERNLRVYADVIRLPWFITTVAWEDEALG